MIVCVDDVTDAIDGNELDVGNGRAEIVFRLLWLPSSPFPAVPTPLVAPPTPTTPPPTVDMDIQLIAERGVGGCCGGIWANGEVNGLPISVTRDT